MDPDPESSKWRPFGQETHRRLLDLAQDELDQKLAAKVDAPISEEGGRNHYWAATNELAANWRNSSNKDKWKSGLKDLDLNQFLKDQIGDFESKKKKKETENLADMTMFLKIDKTSKESEKIPSENEEGLTVSEKEEPIDSKTETSQDENLPPPAKKFNFGIFSGAKRSPGQPVTASECQAKANYPAPSSSSNTAGLQNDSETRKTKKRRFGLPGITPLSPPEKRVQGGGGFRTAGQKLLENHMQKNRGLGGNNNNATVTSNSYGSSTKTLGASRPVGNAFKPPVMDKQEDEGSSMSKNVFSSSNHGEEVVDERLKNVDPKMIELVKNEIMDSGAPIDWDDIAGLDFVKGIIKEIIVFPMLRPDIFTGLKAPPKGILLFGPPGTGKTLIGKCIASKSKSTFFAISASSLTSKWVGEGEKMVRALFAVARVFQPSVIFIDEIDSLLTARSDTEHESSRRLKTEFLVQLDGASTQGEEKILIVGATNRPQDLDEAARRRLVKRLYVPLPEDQARLQIIENLMQKERHDLTMDEKQDIISQTDGYSGADMANLCRDAAIGPVRSLDYSKIESISKDDIRPIAKIDFDNALKQVRASVSDKDLALYEDWNARYGSGK